MASVEKLAVGWTESRLLPDPIIRAGIRRLNRQRLAGIHAEDMAGVADRMEAFVARMQVAEVAPLPHRANEQHYELPAEFFARVLGKHGKYSCCYWDGATLNLDQAETTALSICCQRAAIEQGMTVLDLGCGWGSLSLWIASKYPGVKVVAVSNSNAQRQWIEAVANERGLNNIRIITADMNDFANDENADQSFNQTFDRIVSVEMFEHMRNYPELFRRIAGWLKPQGQFFMHIFCHRNSAYEFVDQGPSDWMSRHFFAGGIMPSFDLPLRFQQHLALQHRAAWGGEHYARTANAWLQNMDRQRAEIRPLFEKCYGAESADLWFQRWRIFFMACAELFGQNNGQEWFVGHYLFARQEDSGSQPAAQALQP
ncbi:MAG: cyclopropane-fatty-acyl-phospholipid synthase family protein [Xanthomonadales bacterium]|nr:cyclopropane-fatty-acyl-phospholipid synthase family protein [Xanthomonadales bacterium]